MTPIVVQSRVNSEGVLHLDMPVGLEQADKEVRVTVEPLPAGPVSQDEWHRAILSTAGKWQGEFERPEQGEYEQREPLA
jgi:hypothetical protein